MELAGKLARGSGLAIRLTKKGIYQNLSADLPSAPQYEASAQTISVFTQDIQERIEAFLEKREPNSQGK